MAMSVSFNTKNRRIFMKRSVRVTLLVVTFVVSSLFMLTLNVGAAEESVIKLRYSNIYPATHPFGVLADDFCKEIEKRTNGKVKITHFAGNTLTPANQNYDSVVKGISDIGQSLLAYSAGRFPLTDAIDYPFGYTSGYQATMLINEYYKKFKPAELNDTHVLYLHAHGPGYFSTKKEISKIADLEGLRIKANGTNAELAKIVKATPVTITMPETYDALSKGLLDGVLLPLEGIKNWGYGDILRYALRNYGCSYTSGLYITMNKQKWESLPADIQKIFTEVSEEWMKKQAELWSKLDIESEEALVKTGFKVVVATPEEQAAVKEKVKPMFDQYIRKMKEKGLPGEEVVKFCSEYIATHP
jgi:TRAP-type C4-dicarboxylate transport system substrate-binding protein